MTAHCTFCREPAVDHINLRTQPADPDNERDPSKFVVVRYCQQHKEEMLPEVAKSGGWDPNKLPKQ